MKQMKVRYDRCAEKKYIEFEDCAVKSELYCSNIQFAKMPLQS